ncbi:MAG: YbhB/YbcL family Raf kinase inhibitor-like protein [Burkholderiales bacterium]
MRLWSDSFADGARIPARYAAGRPDATSVVSFSDNLNPHLAWDGVPPTARSLVLVCHDRDVPSRGDDVNQAGREVPADLPRVDFFHWVMVDLPVSLRAIAEGEFSRSFTARGKPGPATLHGARHGLNDYTGWFAGDAERAGQYHGYDGPFPPFNDSILHHYVFTLYALDVARCNVDGSFTGAQVREAIAGRVLAEAAWTGVYTLNARLG